MFKYLISFTSANLFFLFTSNVFSQCNGSIDSCNKRYDEVAYLTTHNAFNSRQDSFLFPNHNTNIEAQLNSGVRALMIDVYEDNGVSVVYHGYSFLGSKPLSTYLNTIKHFLDTNPNEIITIILECYTNANAIENDMSNAGLTNYLHSQNSNSPWSTLQTMINSNKRLVVLSDKSDATSNQDWYHYVWDFAVENKYGEINCDYNRGNPSNKLFIYNHFVTSNMGSVAKARRVNSNPDFLNYVTQCQLLKNKFPNFITVDFYEIGDALEVVNLLNFKSQLVE
jgi:hypothetical protein